MLHEQAGRDALLLHRRDVGFHDAAAAAFVDERAQLRIPRRRQFRERVLRRHRDEGHAHDRVGPRREYLELAALAVDVVGEGQVHAVAAADPVRLHRAHAFGPVGELVERAEQLVRVLRDAEVVHRDLALLDERARPPAAAVDDLLVGEHGLVDRVPVHDARLLVGDAALEHAQEEPLVPAVVIRVAGRELARPVDAEAERLELAFHVRDVVAGPARGRDAVLDRGVFRRQSECVPTHRLQDVVSLHPHVPRQHVADRVIPHVPHVQPAARVREHAEAVVLRLRGVFARDERAGGVPFALDGRLDFLRFVAVFHRTGRIP